MAYSSVGTRRAVSSLDRSGGEWPQELSDYAQAIAAMKELGDEDTRSLAYQAAIHGHDSGGSGPHGEWNWCQHQSWFFLPWHRMYLLQFEKIICHLINKPDFRLPYWDYTSDDSTTWSLPPEFTSPAEESNHLWVNGRFAGGAKEGHQDAGPALEARVFTTEGPGENFGSGMIDQPVQFGTTGETGAVEGTPHNVVHMDVGGLMGNPYTAAFDPIFWLHHANIDRLWEVWRNQDSRLNPEDQSWLDTKFKFPDPEQGHIELKVADVLDTAAIGYVYDDVTPPGRTEAAPGRLLTTAVAEAPREAEPVGASNKVLLVPGESTTIKLDRASTTRRSLTSGAGETVDERDVFLRLEGVRGSNVQVGVYGIYVGVPEDADPTNHPELKAGLLSTFGLEASTSGGGHGITQSMKITDIARLLRDEGRWDPTTLRVSFVEETPKQGFVESEPQDVRAERISVYYA